MAFFKKKTFLKPYLSIFLSLFFFFLVSTQQHINQGSQSRTGGYTGWTSGTIYFGTCQYQCTVSGLPLLYIYIYMYVCMYVCMCMCVCVCVCVIINIKVYQKTFPLFKTNYSWFQTLVSIKRRKKKHNIKNRKLNCSLHTKKKKILIS